MVHVELAMVEQHMAEGLGSRLIRGLMEVKGVRATNDLGSNMLAAIQVQFGTTTVAKSLERTVVR